MLISEAATERPGKGRVETVVMISDVARAFFEADAKRELCVELPAEAKTAKDEAEDNVAFLKKSLYGTRDAAQNFQREVQRFMEASGFKVGKYNMYARISMKGET